jgi:hypothetical protein
LLVVFIDMLEVQGITKRMNPNLVFNMWTKIIIHFINSIKHSPLKQARNQFRILSDTIIITFECSPKKVISIFDFVMNPFIISMNFSLFLRG